MKKMKGLAALAVMAAMISVVSGCVTQHAAKSKSPLVTYYGALADYNGAKRVALAYVELPSTTKAEADVVVKAVARGDQAVDETEKLRAQCAVEAIAQADATVPDVAAELTSDEFQQAFEAARSIAFAACLPDSKLEAVGRVLQAVAAELRARALEVD